MKVIFLTTNISNCSWFTHHAEIHVKDISLDLSMSTVIGLGDLAEDEIITAPMPVTVYIYKSVRQYDCVIYLL